MLTNIEYARLLFDDIINNGHTLSNKDAHQHLVKLRQTLINHMKSIQKNYDESVPALKDIINAAHDFQNNNISATNYDQTENAVNSEVFTTTANIEMDHNDVYAVSNSKTIVPEDAKIDGQAEAFTFTPSSSNTSNAQNIIIIPVASTRLKRCVALPTQRFRTGMFCSICQREHLKGNMVMLDCGHHFGQKCFGEKDNCTLCQRSFLVITTYREFITKVKKMNPVVFTLSDSD